MRRGVAIALLLVWSACAFRQTQPASHPPKPEESQLLLSQARENVANGKYVEARKLYILILEKYPKSPEAFDARWGMAWIRVDPRSPLRDYAAARTNFNRLAADYGSRGGDWLAWVQAWQAVLERLAAAENEGVALKNEGTELKNKKEALEDDLVGLESDLDKLRELEMNLEVKP
jgi:hypothetical protein